MNKQNLEKEGRKGECETFRMLVNGGASSGVFTNYSSDVYSINHVTPKSEGATGCMLRTHLSHKFTFYFGTSL